MNREKQIEEMARCICERDDGDICTLDSKSCDCKCTSGSIAELLYDRGYRKQSDLTPCDVCRFNPPTSGDGKPCFICPAQMKGGVR